MYKTKGRERHSKSALVTIAKAFSNGISSNTTRIVDGRERRTKRLVLLLRNLLIGHLRIDGKVALRKEGDALELILKDVESMTHLRTLNDRIKGDGATDLIVGPVALHKGRKRELFPHRDLLGLADAIATVDRKADDNGRALAANGGFDVVSGLCETGDEIRVLGETNTTQIEATDGIVDAWCGTSKERDGSTGLDARCLDGTRDGKPARIQIGRAHV